MQNLSINEEYKMSRKEYLKDKKKQKKKLNKINKKKYIVIGFISILAIYVFVQFYIYYKQNNYVYLTDENVDNQEVYNMYFLTEGYTYDPKTSLNLITTDSLSESTIAKNIGFTNITQYENFIYGIKENGLYKINKNTYEVSMIVEKDVNKFINYKKDIYFLTGKENKLIYVNSETKEQKDLGIKNVKEVLVDENYIFACITDLEKSILVRINKDGTDKKELTKNEKVSYVIQDLNRLIFVNKGDDNKIYSVNKDGSDLKKILDVKSVSDSGDTEYIDGDKYMFVKDDFLYYINTEDNENLWKASLTSDVKEEILHTSIDVLEFMNNTIFYKNKNERGIYLYNLDTNFTSQISQRLIKEFIVEDKVEKSNEEN